MALLLEVEAAVLELATEDLSMFASILFSMPSSLSDFCVPEVVDDASTILVDSKESFDGSNLPSLLPDLFSVFGFLPFLPFLEDEEEDETTDDESPPPRSPFTSVTPLPGTLPPDVEFKLEVEQVKVGSILLLLFVIVGFEVLLTDSELVRFARL